MSGSSLNLVSFPEDSFTEFETIKVLLDRKEYELKKIEIALENKEAELNQFQHELLIESNTNQAVINSHLQEYEQLKKELQKKEADIEKRLNAVTQCENNLFKK